MRTESAQPQLAEDAERSDLSLRMAVDMRKRNVILLVPPTEKLPEGWQLPWVNAGWLVSNCGSSERIPAALHGPGESALVISPWAEIGKPSLSGSVARGLSHLHEALGPANDARPGPPKVRGGMVRRAVFLSHLAAVGGSAASGCSALMAVQVDQASKLNARLSRIAVIDIEERICARIASVLDKQDVTTIWLEFGFGVLAHRQTSEEIWELADRLRARIADEPFVLDDEAIGLSVSVGLALSPSETRDNVGQQWFASAHAAQGIAHRHGGNRCEGLLTRAFEPMPAERVLIIREWVEEAKAGGNVMIEYQPLVPLNSAAAEIYSVHAKLRDHRDPLGGVHRGEYLRLAREAGAMAMIDRMSLFHAFETLEQEHARGRGTQVIVPIELETLKDLPWRWLEAELRRRQHLLGRLIVELEASPVLLDKDSVKRIVRLRRYGVRIGLSDPGDTLEGVATWAKLPADFLRLRHAAAGSVSADEFRAAMASWKSKGRSLIVDEVEETRAVAQLGSIGVDHLRGHALGAIGPRLDHDFSVSI
ncbi:MAG: EAL domain-containing protein [Dokdonella sp.]